MNSINDKMIILQMLDDSTVLEVLEVSDNSDKFRYEFMNQELHNYYRIKKCYLNSLYFKLVAMKKDSNTVLIKVA